MFLAEKQFAEKNRLLFKLQTKLEPLSFTPLKLKKFNAIFYKSNVNELIDHEYWSSTMDIIKYCSVVNTFVALFRQYFC